MMISPVCCSLSTSAVRNVGMIGKILSQLLGNASEDLESAGAEHEKLLEFEDEGWVIVNLPGEKVNLLQVFTPWRRWF